MTVYNDPLNSNVIMVTNIVVVLILLTSIGVARYYLNASTSITQGVNEKMGPPP